MKRVLFGVFFIILSIWQYSEGSNHLDNSSYIAFGTIFLLIGAVLILVSIMNKDDEKSVFDKREELKFEQKKLDIKKYELNSTIEKHKEIYYNKTLALIGSDGPFSSIIKAENLFIRKDYISVGMIVDYLTSSLKPLNFFQYDCQVKILKIGLAIARVDNNLVEINNYNRKISIANHNMLNNSTTTTVAISINEIIIELDTIAHIKKVAYNVFLEEMIKISSKYDIINDEPEIAIRPLLNEYKQVKIDFINSILNNPQSNEILRAVSKEKILATITITYDEILYKFIKVKP